MAESVSVDVLAKVFGTRDVAKLGDEFAKTAVTADAAAASLKVWNDVAAKSAKADATLVASRNAHAKADKLVADAENVLAGKATQYTRLLSDQRAKTDDVAKSAENAAGRFSALAGTGGAAGGGMGALIGAGVVLSPILLTVGAGLSGLALAALSAGKKSQQLRQELAPLKADFAAFGKQLQPVVLQDFAKAAQVAGTILRGIEPVTAAVGKGLAGVLGQVDAEFKSGTWQQFFAFMARTAGPDMALLGKNITDLLQVVPPLAQDLQPLAHGMLVLSDDAALAAKHVTDFYNSFQKNVPISNQHTFNAIRDLDHWVVSLTDHIPGAKAVNNWITNLQHTATGAAGAQGHLATATQSATAALAAQAHQLNLTAAGYVHALTPLENYISANITEANDLHAAKVALRASGDAIGYKTQKERDSFGTVQQYITNTISQGNSALAAHKGIDAQIASIRNALPFLESVKGKTAAYKQELDLLKGILDKLRAEKLIQEQVKVTGQGTWHLAKITTTGPQGQGVGRAAGGLIPGAGNSDSYPAMLTPGEVVVPKGMVAAGAVNHLRGSLPGFASGGVVPSYHGSPAGLPPWTSRNQQATITSLTASIGSAMAAAFKAAVQAAQAAFAGAPGALGGPASASAAQAQAYARSRLGAYGWSSGQMPPLIALWNGESGWNRLARNPTSGAYGIPQALPASKMGAAANPPTSSAAAQINWGMGYIRGVYGTPSNAYSTWLGRSPHWYDHGGFLPPGLSMAYNGTGRPEMVVPDRGDPAQHVVMEIRASDAEVSQFLVRLLKRHVRVAGGGNVQVAFATSR